MNCASSAVTGMHMHMADARSQALTRSMLPSFDVDLCTAREGKAYQRVHHAEPNLFGAGEAAFRGMLLCTPNGRGHEGV